LKMGPIGFPETSANNYRSARHGIPEERRCYLTPRRKPEIKTLCAVYFERHVKRLRALRGQNTEFCMLKHVANIVQGYRTSSSPWRCPLFSHAKISVLNFFLFKFVEMSRIFFKIIYYSFCVVQGTKNS
jgi:hypothetical protein